MDHNYTNLDKDDMKEEDKIKKEEITVDIHECGGLQYPNQLQATKKQKARKGLLIVSYLCILAIGIEVAGGFYAHSLAILTDAAHLLSDLAGFMISLFALWISSKRPTQ